MEYFNDMKDYSELIHSIKSLTSKEYSWNIKARDFAEIVQALCILYKSEDKFSRT